MKVYNLSEDGKTYIRITEKDEQITLKWIGIIDMEDTNETLSNFLINYHEECKKKNIKVLKSDFTELEFLNSVGIKNIINWIHAITKDDVYKIYIIYSRNHTWQRVTFSTIQHIVKDIKVIMNRRDE